MMFLMKRGLTSTALAAALLGLSLSPLLSAQDSQQPVPDAPSPQPQQAPLSSLSGPIKPGGGAGTETSGSADLPNSNAPANQPAAPPPPKPQDQSPPPEFDNPEQIGQRLKLYTNYINVPVTVKDSNGKLVAGLTW